MTCKTIDLASRGSPVNTLPETRRWIGPEGGDTLPPPQTGCNPKDTVYGCLHSEIVQEPPNRLTRKPEGIRKTTKQPANRRRQPTAVTPAAGTPAWRQPGTIGTRSAGHPRCDLPHSTPAAEPASPGRTPP